MEYFHGYDLGLTGASATVLDNEGNRLFSETFKNKLRGCERLVFIRDKCIEVLEKYPPTVICIEDYAMGARGNNFHIGEGGGIVKVAMFEMDLDPVLVSPTRLKKFISKKGSCEKDMIIMHLFKNFGYEAGDNNQADSCGLAIMAKTLHTEDYEGLTIPQIEAIKDTLNPPPKKKKKKTEHNVANPRKKRGAPKLLRRSSREK
jgi:Holliday junction resolvasome RuvABC endonuclease subunit